MQAADKQVTDKSSGYTPDALDLFMVRLVASKFGLEEDVEAVINERNKTKQYEKTIKRN